MRRRAKHFAHLINVDDLPEITMETYQQEFIALAIEHQALCFGEFTLKSGRVSPYFFNAGQFFTGKALAELGRFYAAALMAADVEFDLIFGPAYKGIPLASLTAAALAAQYDRDYRFCYNRKEAKDHGEGGTLVGAPLTGKVLAVDDVITAGTAIGEVADIIAAHGAQFAGVLIGLDRQEKGKNEQSAIQEVEQRYGIPVISIIRLEHIIDYLRAQGETDKVEHMLQYRKVYGI